MGSPLPLEAIGNPTAVCGLNEEHGVVVVKIRKDYHRQGQEYMRDPKPLEMVVPEHRQAAQQSQRKERHPTHEIDNAFRVDRVAVGQHECGEFAKTVGFAEIDDSQDDRVQRKPHQHGVTGPTMKGMRFSMRNAPVPQHGPGSLDGKDYQSHVPHSRPGGHATHRGEEFPAPGLGFPPMRRLIQSREHPENIERHKQSKGT